MKNQNFKSVKIGDKVNFISLENEVRQGEVVYVKRASFTIEYVYQLPNGEDSIGSSFFKLKDGSYGYQNSQQRETLSRCLEII